jgi:hypothetical protein
VHVAENLHIVFSQPPEGVSEEEFNRWYDAHVPEILAAPGFVAARRFRLDPIVQDAVAPVPFRYLALYEVEGDPDEALAELAKLGLGSKDSYAELKEVDSSGPELPGWWEHVRFASWNAVPLGERVESPA